MGMNVPSLSVNGEPEILMDVNTTPLVGVMLVLLAMLILTVPIQKHAINVDITEYLPAQQPVNLDVFIDFDGIVYWDGQALPNHAAVDAKMQEVGAMAGDQPDLIIRPNKVVDYGVVAGVMASAQRNGVRRIGMSIGALGIEPFTF